MSLPTLDRVRELLRYDPATGVFTWRITISGRIIEGNVAGSLQKFGYRQIMIDGKRLVAGRLAWFYINGRWPVCEIDHVNGVRDDDRISNLREATRAQNNQNRGPYGRSGIKGVFFLEGRKKWRASIKRDGRLIHLGEFDTADAAGSAYAGAAAEQYGDFARAS